MEHSYKLKSKDVILTYWPNECPFCHKHINPDEFGYNYEQGFLDLVFKCSYSYCHRLFIVRYQTQNDYTFFFDSITIGETKPIVFSQEINSTSPAFVKIYNEANFAETNQLLEICGVGYRKALEFLIKDYIIKRHPERRDSVKRKFLGKCIQEDVTDTKIVAVSKRAAWLGNDETHYVREWNEENLESLKKLIALTTHWIEMEILTESFEKKMPDKK